MFKSAVCKWLCLVFIFGTSPAALRADPSAPMAEIAVAQAATGEITLTGFTRARTTLPLIAETGGKVLEVTVDVGDRISADGVFARLEKTFIELDLQANQVLRDKLSIQIRYDEKELLRLRTLGKSKNVSDLDVDKADRALLVDREELRDAQIKAEILEERLRRTEIVAPPGWRVTERAVEPGQWVDPGQRLGEVADFSLLRVPFGLTPEQLGALRGIADLSLKLSPTDQSVTARIFRINPDFDAATRKIMVELSVAADQLPDARGGLLAELRLDVADRLGAVLLPKPAVHGSYEESWVVREDGRRVQVVVLGDGRDPSMTRVVADGLSPGQRFRVETN